MTARPVAARRRPSFARMGAAAAAVTAGLLLSGCDADQVGAAAVVDGERISVEEVQRAADALRAAGAQEQAPGALAQQRLRELILARLVDRVAQDRRVTVSEGDVATAVAEARQGRAVFAEPLMSYAEAPPEVAEVTRPQLRMYATLEKLIRTAGAGSPQAALEEIEKQVTEAAKRMSIEVNPRFGGFDAERLQVIPKESGGLASPEARPAPSPSPSPAPGAGG